jgi:hypothetical protein
LSPFSAEQFNGRLKAMLDIRHQKQDIERCKTRQKNGGQKNGGQKNGGQKN